MTAPYTPSFKKLMLAGVGLAIVMPQDALAQQARQVQPASNSSGPRTVSSWNLDTRLTYSDNFRRLAETRRASFISPEGDERQTIGLVPVIDPQTGLPIRDPDTGEVLTVPGLVPLIERLPVEPPDNVIATIGLRGGSVLDRPGITAIVSGGVRISTYLDQTSLDERLADTVDDDDLPTGVSPEDAIVFGLRDLDDVFIVPDLTASGTVRVVEDFFYVDAAALADQQNLQQFGQLEEQSEGQLGDRVTFLGVSLSPYLFRTLAGESSIEARYRVTGIIPVDEQFQTEGPDQDAPAEDFKFSNESLSNELLLEYRTGDLLGQFGAAVTGVAVKTEEDGSDVLREVDLERLSAAFEGSYDVNRRLTITATAGYDDVSLTLNRPGGGEPAQDRASGDSLSGGFWSVGFEARPGQRSSLSASVGERFGGTLIEADGSYRPTARLTVTMGAERDLRTGSQDNFVGFGALNGQTLRIVDQLSQAQGATAQRILDQAVSFQGSFNDVQRGQQGAGTFNRYRFGVSYNTARTNLSANANYIEQQLLGRGDDADDQPENEIIGVQLAAQRQVSRRITITGNARYLENSGAFLFAGLFADEQGATSFDAQETFVSIGASYQIGPRVSATAQAYRSERETDGGTFFDFEENAVSAGLRWTF